MVPGTWTGQKRNIAMPSFVIAHGSGRSDHFDATLCNPNVAIGQPDRRSDVRVRIKLIDERTLTVDGESRSILSTAGGSGTVTYLISGSTKKLRNAERRIALEKAHAALRQLAALMRPLAAANSQQKRWGWRLTGSAKRPNVSPPRRVVTMGRPAMGNGIYTPQYPVSRREDPFERRRREKHEEATRRQKEATKQQCPWAINPRIFSLAMRRFLRRYDDEQKAGETDDARPCPEHGEEARRVLRSDMGDFCGIARA
jgi:hypothetical protein